MIKAIMFFILVWVLVVFAIVIFRIATNQERWAITKTAFYAAVTAVIALVLVTLIVILF